jgi:flavin-binding protein dodecin
MDNTIYKLIEIVGTSEYGIDEAIKNAINRTHKTISHLEWFKVTEIRGCIEEGNVKSFQVVLKIGFRVEDGSEAGADIEAHFSPSTNHAVENGSPIANDSNSKTQAPSVIEKDVSDT